jgi:hypothetical protein
MRETCSTYQIRNNNYASRIAISISDNSALKYAVLDFYRKLYTFQLKVEWYNPKTDRNRLCRI